MPQITPPQARKFLDKISEKDKIAIITHDDLDGFSSGIMLYDFCKSKGVKDIKIKIIRIAKTEIPEDFIKNRNKILITDLGSDIIKKDLETIDKYKKEILYIDHHENIPGFNVPKDILNLRKPEASSVAHLIYTKIMKNYEKDQREWMLPASMVADCGTLRPENALALQKFLKNKNLTLKKLKEKIHKIDLFLVFFDNKLEKAFEIILPIKTFSEFTHLKKYTEPVEKEIQKIEKEYEKNKEKISNINFFYFEPNFSIKSITSTRISFKYPNESFIFATKEKSAKNKIRLSGRNQSGNTNMIQIIKAGIVGLENASAGGHPRASGGFIQSKDLEKFKQNLRNFLKK
tara:strand:+ start:117 stop:1154 length:1038 start_codon:yes stop_codon:yes gene_type:complete